MSDLRISMAYLTSSEVRRIGSELRSDPSDTQAGWYVRAYRNEGYDDILKYTRVVNRAYVERIASDADAAAGANTQPILRAVQEVQRNLDHTRAQRLAAAQRRREEAEAEIAAIEAER